MIFSKDLEGQLKGKLLKNESLAKYTSWRTGGPADYLYLPKDLEDLQCFLRLLPKDVPLTWLGLGSNTLVRDSGIEGIVVITQGALKQQELLADGLIRAEAGVSAGQLARFSARASLGGLEFMAGIPGTVGGALAMNAGCYGSETWDHVQSVEMINRSGEVKKLDVSQFEVGYRHVARSQDEWFVAGVFRLESGDKSASLEMIRNLLEKRNNSQPTGLANCGSVFRNPPECFSGQLIERCGLKGYQQGGAMVSTKHANFIINSDQATSSDIEQLIEHVSACVEKETGIKLIREVCIIGKE